MTPRQTPITDTAKQYYLDMRRRFYRGKEMPDHVGYATPGWTGLLKYLLREGYTETEAVEAGLCIRARQHAYDRHRDELLDLSGETINPWKEGM